METNRVEELLVLCELKLIKQVINELLTMVEDLEKDTLRSYELREREKINARS